MRDRPPVSDGGGVWGALSCQNKCSCQGSRLKCFPAGAGGSYLRHLGLHLPSESVWIVARSTDSSSVFHFNNWAAGAGAAARLRVASEGGAEVVDRAGRAARAWQSPSVSAALIACRGIDLWWVQGHRNTQSLPPPCWHPARSPSITARGWLGGPRGRSTIQRVLSG